MTWLLFWIFVIIVTLIAEIFTIAFVSLWFTVGAGLALICNLLGLPLFVQWIVFIVVSVVGILLFGYIGDTLGYYKGMIIASCFSFISLIYSIILK